MLCISVCGKIQKTVFTLPQFSVVWRQLKTNIPVLDLKNVRVSVHFGKKLCKIRGMLSKKTGILKGQSKDKHTAAWIGITVERGWAAQQPVSRGVKPYKEGFYYGFGAFNH
jgi:hypothetical protein